MTERRIQPVSIEFKDARAPYSPLFQDIYFSPETGIEESRYAYLEGSGFLEKLAEGSPHLTVGEIGFGVGLNFLLTLKAFSETAKPGQKLHYVSFEKFPVFKKDLETLYSAYPELKSVADLLLAQYPVLTPGVHRLYFLNERVTLDLVLGDALLELPRLEFRANHWYWDGFAPSKNEDAFSTTVFQEVARLSAKGAQGSTFTAASFVRHNLTGVGFKVIKRKGFGPKRESIQAVYEGGPKASILNPWFSSRALAHLKPGDTVGVLGAGLAGSAVARKLANLGFSVRVYDGQGISQRASSNSVALFNVQLSKQPNPISRFSQQALTHFLREVRTLGIPFKTGILRQDETGVETLINNDFPESFYQEREDGLYFPECGMIHPGVLCKTRLTHPLITFIQESVVRVESGESNKVLYLKNGTREEVDHVVHALGADLKLPVNVLDHEALQALPLKPIRGQTILVKPTEKSKTLSTLLVNDGYASPVAPEITGHEFHLLGATYQAKTIAENQEELDTETLLAKANKNWSLFSETRREDVVSAKEGFRLASPDKLPLIGPVCSPEWLEKNHAHALRGTAFSDLPLLQALNREWMLTSLGSRGVTYSSLGADILVSQMLGGALPIELDLLEHLHSSRFFIRNLRKPRVS